MIQLKLTAHWNDGQVDQPVEFKSGVYHTMLQALAALEREQEEFCCTSFVDDSAIDWDVLFNNLTNGEAYHRNCFATPEDNFTIESISVMA